MASPSTRVLDRIMNGARFHLPGVLDDVLKHELFAVLDDFFQSTLLWQERVPVRTVAGGVRTDYLFEPQDNRAQTISILGVEDATGGTIRASMPVLGTLFLHEPRAAAEYLYVTVALTVVDPVTSTGYPEVPGEVVERYHSGLTSGLIGALAAQPAKPYSNRELASFHMRLFSAAKNRARVSARKNHLFGGQRWAYPQAFATSSRR